VARKRTADDHRVVRLSLTKSGPERLEALSRLHVEELRRLASQLSDIGDGLDAPGQTW
jgi:DNA-binding MarR family transcriptional regulator